MSTFLCSLRPGPAAAGLLGSLSLDEVVIVAHEKKQSLTRCVAVMALDAWRRGGSGEVGRSECPNGRCIPARGETPGTVHNRSVLKERRRLPDALTTPKTVGW